MFTSKQTRKPVKKLVADYNVENKLAVATRVEENKETLGMQTYLVKGRSAGTVLPLWDAYALLINPEYYPCFLADSHHLVDPDSGLQDEGKVVERKDVIYNVMLNMTGPSPLSQFQLNSISLTLDRCGTRQKFVLRYPANRK